jgi:hypothetical protein
MQADPKSKIQSGRITTSPFFSLFKVRIKGFESLPANFSSFPLLARQRHAVSGGMQSGTGVLI